jgi:deoxyribodipyrimidine photo-lyase
MNFPTDYESIKARLVNFEITNYAKTRNYIDGSVSYLSPYIARGFLSTRQVFQFLKEQGLSWSTCEKFIQELAWRDYFQQVFKHEKGRVFQDFKHEQPRVLYHDIPHALEHASSGIEALDQGIITLKTSGYMHNHMRMYIASLVCNIGSYHWKSPAEWMYYHLLDGDIASNHLSWQWVAGSFSNKKYYANQDNINRFCASKQKNTFLDVDYEEFAELEVPSHLKESVNLTLKTDLSDVKAHKIEHLKQKPTLVYNYYNLDPFWHLKEDYQRVLLLEPSYFEAYPVSQQCIDFVLGLAQNIAEIKVLVAEFDELDNFLGTDQIIYKEHPLNEHYKGHEEERYWLSSVEGYFPSFFKFWNRAQKELRREFTQEN